MAPRNVMVTGASAPIGERMVRTLLDDSRVDKVLAITGDPVEHFPVAPQDRLTALQVDLARSRRVHALLFGPARDLDIDAVVHLARHRSATEEGRKIRAFNVESLRSILQLAERHPTIQRFVLRSDAAVYKVRNDLPALMGEEHPLNLAGGAPQWVRDRVEADITACNRMGLSRLSIVVLRMAEALAPGAGSQLYDYLASPVCFRPAGFDPMVNVLTIADTVAALQKALHSDAQGVFNIPGADTLPLSACIRSYGRINIPLPGPALSPLYRWRARLRGHDFRYGMNARRFHFSVILDGTRAQEVLGFVPCHPVSWPAAPAEADGV